MKGCLKEKTDPRFFLEIWLKMLGEEYYKIKREQKYKFNTKILLNLNRITIKSNKKKIRNLFYIFFSGYN